MALPISKMAMATRNTAFVDTMAEIWPVGDEMSAKKHRRDGELEPLTPRQQGTRQRQEVDSRPCKPGSVSVRRQRKGKAAHSQGLSSSSWNWEVTTIENEPSRVLAWIDRNESLWIYPELRWQ